HRAGPENPRTLLQDAIGGVRVGGWAREIQPGPRLLLPDLNCPVSGNWCEQQSRRRALRGHSWWLLVRRPNSRTLRPARRRCGALFKSKCPSALSFCAAALCATTADARQ